MKGEQEIFQKILNQALKIASFKAISKNNLIFKLQKKFPVQQKIIDQVVQKLIENKILDDQKLAQFFVESRLNCAPRGKKLLKIELSRQGIADDLIEQVLQKNNIDEEKIAFDLAKVKSKTFSKNLEIQKKKEKLMRFLQSRGFDFAAIYKVIDEVELSDD